MTSGHSGSRLLTAKPGYLLLVAYRGTETLIGGFKKPADSGSSWPGPSEVPPGHFLY
jgi:hypothetical protein